MEGDLMRRRLLPILVIVPVVLILTSSVAGACGGLVGENGTIQLTRTSTLAAHHNGIERYVTSFEFTGQGAEVGSIIPLPAVPTKVERGGDWTLQRLAREVAPPRALAASTAGDTALLKEAQVILETKIDALDITILKGGSDAVGQWAVDHGFLLTPDAPEVLAFYAERSPIFMAARFDATRARDLGQQSGDGTPIMLTIPTDDPWVPIRILALGQGKAKVVNADVFLLTDERPTLRTGGDGLILRRSERASDLLLDDLRSDKGMEWVPDHMWFTYLAVDAPAQQLDYDLAISSRTGVIPSARAVGFNFPGGPSLQGGNDVDSQIVWWGLALLAAAIAIFVVLRVRTARTSTTGS
jgi:hypothetical protein